MIVKRMPEPFEAVIVENTFSENELSEIWKELSFLTREEVLLDPEKTGTAKAVGDSRILKKNKAVFLYSIYINPQISPIIKYTAKKIFNPEIYSVYEDIGIIHRNFSRTNKNGTLLSYYENSDYYDFHRDECLYTSVTYLFKEPKNFSGGNISFKLGDSIYKQEIKNNMSIVFPSFYEHMVDEINMNSDVEKYSGFGRYCITQFAFLSASN